MTAAASVPQKAATDILFHDEQTILPKEFAGFLPDSECCVFPYVQHTRFLTEMQVNIQIVTALVPN